MARRKRLTPAAPARTLPLETKASPNGWVGVRHSVPPIADVAGAASATAALEDIAQEMRDARAQGRMVQEVPLECIDAAYLVRDRKALDEDEMCELMASLAARGQQMPVEVVALERGRYGLISGWRRLSAMQRLYADTGEGQYGHIKCLLRAPEAASDAYVAMVEENEIRAPLSFYERAHVAARAAEQGAFASPREAVKALFAAVSPSKRSKIHSFGVIYAHLDPALRFGREIPEHLGLALAKALEADGSFGKRLSGALQKAEAQKPADERVVLEQGLKGAQTARPAPATDKRVAVGWNRVHLSEKNGRVVLTGAGVDAALVSDLRDWLSARTK